MNNYLFDIDDIVEYDSRTGITRGPIIGRQSFSDGNFYYVGLDSPRLTEILIREDQLRKVD